MVSYQEVSNWKMKFERCANIREKYGIGSSNYRKLHNLVCYSKKTLFKGALVTDPTWGERWVKTPYVTWKRIGCPVQCSIENEKAWLRKIMLAVGTTEKDKLEIAKIKAGLIKFVYLIEKETPFEEAVLKARYEEPEAAIVKREIEAQVIKTSIQKDTLMPTKDTKFVDNAKEISAGILLLVVGAFIGLYVLIQRGRR